MNEHGHNFGHQCAAVAVPDASGSEEAREKLCPSRCIAR